jgi:succinyl-CoA synthetase beta subunit
VRIHEYQAKQLFAEFGIPVAPSQPATSVDTAVDAASVLGYPVVVKAQIHAGGRGKAGGIRVAQDEASVRRACGDLLGAPLVTHQTGPAGRIVRTVLIEKAAEISSELYLGMTVDRARRSIVVMASRHGGVDIEEVSRSEPGAVIREWIDPLIGLRPFHAFRVANALGLSAAARKEVSRVIASLYRLFIDKDCSLAEINPLALAANEEPIAVDAKVTFDDNALYHHPEVAELRDPTEEDPLEVEARAAHLNYVKLDGSVGCLVNGAGLAMATMDLIKHAGAAPANFLDVGGGANAEMIAKGFRILIGDPDVKAVFINIFGGILRCDILANGVMDAAKTVDVTVPVIVRLEGTNVAEGRQILRTSGLAFETADNLTQAAAMIAAAVGTRKESR